ncbi:MAG: tripartite tricarboxylate transporter substrate binding protein [Betaproteobacteria bacterium]|nr:tripartite tricarboxylate transporter substrate binding protein [Betaproteobacteria bacterium]
MKRTKLVQAAVIGMALFSLATLATAQSLVGKTIKVVVTFPAGGVNDLVTRSFTTELGQALGTTVIVENRAGAGGTIATAIVAKAAPDGQTLLFNAAAHTINGSLYQKLSYDPIKDFVGVATVGTSSYQLITSVDLPAKNVAELIAYAKANPGKLNYTTAGVGSASHLSIAYLAGLAGIDLVHVPTKGMAIAANEVVAGRSQMMIFAGGTQYAKEPRVRVMAVTSMKRSKFLPDTPTINESGMPGYDFDTWYGFLAPAGTPRPFVARINAEINRLLKEPVILDRLAKQNLEPLSMSPEQFDQLLRENFKKMAKVVAISGAKID